MSVFLKLREILLASQTKSIVKTTTIIRHDNVFGIGVDEFFGEPLVVEGGKFVFGNAEMILVDKSYLTDGTSIVINVDGRSNNLVDEENIVFLDGEVVFSVEGGVAGNRVLSSCYLTDEGIWVGAIYMAAVRRQS